MPITSGQGNPDWTHEETILALDLLLANYPRVPGKTSKEVRELSRLLQDLPLHPLGTRNDKFRNPDGVYLKLQQLLSLDPTLTHRKGLKPSTMDRQVWAEFRDDRARLRAQAELIRCGIRAAKVQSLNLPEADADEELWEGEFLTRVHKARERARGLRNRLLKRAHDQGGLACEACGAAPRLSGSTPLEEAEFEAHHRVPLAAAVEVRKTALRDLALLCAGCHRLIHALSRDQRRFVDIDDLRRVLGKSAGRAES